MKTRTGLTRGMALGLLLLGVVVAFVSYRVGRGHEIQGAATGGREPGKPSKSFRERPSDVLATYRQAAGTDPGVRAGRTTAQVLGVLRRSATGSGMATDPEALHLMDSLERDEVLDALAALESHPEPAGTELRRAVLARWAEFEPRAALTHVIDNMNGTVRVQTIADLLGVWALDDPAAAFAWHRETSEAGTIPNLSSWSGVDRIMHSWAVLDPAAAFAACVEANMPQAWIGFASLAAVDAHRAVAVEHVLSIPDGATRLQALKFLASSWSRVDSPGAAAWLDQQALTGRELEWAVSERFALSDPEANADWLVNRAKTDEARDEAAAAAIRTWARTDPEAAGAWLDSREVAGEKAIGIMVNGCAARDVDRAIEWAQRAPESKRDDLIAQAIAEAVFRNTIKKSAIDDYAGSGSLSKEEMKEKINSALKRINTGWSGTGLF